MQTSTAIAPPHRAAKKGVYGFSWTSLAVFFSLVLSIGAIMVLAATGRVSFWLAVPLNTVLFYYLAHINHEAFHSNINGTEHNTKWLNNAIGRIISFSFWFSFPAFRAVHLAHHRFTNDKEMDSDMWVARENPIAVALSCLTLLNKYEFQMWKLYRRGLLAGHVVAVFYLERMIAAGIVIVAFAAGYGFEAVMLWLVPAFLTIPLLSYFFAYVVHQPHDKTDIYQASNVLIAPRWLQPLITAIFVFQNYHLVHHLNPRIPFYEYGNVYREMEPALEKNGAAITKIFQG